MHLELADHLAEIVVDAVRCIHIPGKEIDLNMVELMHMRHKNALDTKFINGSHTSTPAHQHANTHTTHTTPTNNKQQNIQQTTTIANNNTNRNATSIAHKHFS